jgi:hypothetical protein
MYHSYPKRCDHEISFFHSNSLYVAFLFENENPCDSTSKTTNTSIS